MTSQPPSLEDLLRERLHAVDELTPPDTHFEARALRAGRARANRRRSWARGLVGVAAAAAIGVFVVPSVLRSSVSSGGSAASSAEAAATATKAGPDGPLQQPRSQPGGDVTLTLPVGTTPFDWRSAAGEARLAQLRASLAGPQFAASHTSVRIDDSASPSRLVVRMGTYEAGVIALVTDAFPAGSPIVFSVAAR